MQYFKTKMELNLFVLLVILIAKCNGACKEERNKQVCESVQDIKQSDKKLDWKELDISSRKKEAIRENSFTNVPNVKKLVFYGSINKIDRKSFDGLKELDVLHFFNNDLLELKSNVFANLPVRELLIYTSNVKILRTRCLDNLPNLKSIYIHKNSISIIPAGVFSYTNIEVLFLNENKIKTIEEEAFYGMEKLYKLALERNELTFFDSNLLVGPSSPNLSLLWLARNDLTKFPKDLLTPFPNLKVLLMHINNIDSIENDAFNGMKNLRYIDLSNNKLQTLSHRVFPWEGLEYMDILFLQNNRFIELSTDVIAKLPRLRKIAIGGNPWLCPCYQHFKNYLRKRDITLLCDDEYLEGKRPVCISPSIVTEQCQPQSENPQQLHEFYYNGQMDYIKLPPLCKVYCTRNTSCYSHDFDVLEYS